MSSSIINYALLVIDMQKDFIDFVEPLSKKKANLVVNISKLCSLAIEHSIPIIFIQDTHDLGDQEFSRFSPHCVRNTIGWHLIDEMASIKSTSIAKYSYSAFFNTQLDQYLRSISVSRLIISGVQTHICILSTTLDAYHHGYDPIVVPDCVESISPYRKKIALQWMERYVCKLVHLIDLDCYL